MQNQAVGRRTFFKKADINRKKARRVKAVEVCTKVLAKCLVIWFI